MPCCRPALMPWGWPHRHRTPCPSLALLTPSSGVSPGSGVPVSTSWQPSLHREQQHPRNVLPALMGTSKRLSPKAGPQEMASEGSSCAQHPEHAQATAARGAASPCAAMAGVWGPIASYSFLQQHHRAPPCLPVGGCHFSFRGARLRESNACRRSGCPTCLEGPASPC